MKGGVGKTTLCLGIGEYLAHMYGDNILFIDMDPQFNLTQSLMNEFNLEEKYLDDFCDNRNVRKIFETPTKISQNPGLPTLEDVVVHLDEKIDIIPGTINLIFEDNDRSGAKATRLKKFIKDNRLREKYSYIFIDCPPTISLYTDASLISSDFYLVPNRIDRYSFLGIKLLKQVIDRLKIDNDLSIEPLGIIYTMHGDERYKVNLLKETFEENIIVKEIGLFESRTSYVQDLLVGLQGNIASKYKKSREDINDIVKEFLERIKKYEKHSESY